MTNYKISSSKTSKVGKTSKTRKTSYGIKYTPMPTRKKGKKKHRIEKTKFNFPKGRLSATRAYNLSTRLYNKNTKKVMTYANIVKKDIPLEIKEIPIEKWLKHYNLEQYKRIFSWIRLSFSSLIRSNTDILELFTYESFFEHVIYICADYYNINKASFKKKDPIIFKFKKDVKQFMDAYDQLIKQSNEYKKLRFILGPNASKEEFERYIKSEKFDFIKNKKLKNEIIEKLLLLDMDDLYTINSYDFQDIIKTDMRLLKLYIYHTKPGSPFNFKKGCRPNMTNREFESFIRKNKILKNFVTCHNNFSHYQITQEILYTYNAKNFLDASRLDLFNIIISPMEFCNNYDAGLLRKVYKKIILSKLETHIEEKFREIQKIPPKIDLKKKNYRVFYISGHGYSCDIDEYKNQVRLNYDKLDNNLSKYQFRKDKLNIISTQPIGRYSFSELLLTISDLFTSYYKNSIINTLLHGNKEQYDMLEDYITSLFYSTRLYKESNYDMINFKKLYSRFLNSPGYYINDIETTRNLVNFVKYSNNYPPPDSNVVFSLNSAEDVFLGVLELTSPYHNESKQLIDKINSTKIDYPNNLKKNTLIKMGYNLDSIYNSKMDIPNHSDEILKYNNDIIKLFDKYQSLKYSELIEIIYKNGNIQHNDEIIIITNQCRGVLSKTKYIPRENQTSFNKKLYLSKNEQNELNNLRIKSGTLKK